MTNLDLAQLAAPWWANSTKQCPITLERRSLAASKRRRRVTRHGGSAKPRRSEDNTRRAAGRRDRSACRHCHVALQSQIAAAHCAALQGSHTLRGKNGCCAFSLRTTTICSIAQFGSLRCSQCEAALRVVVLACRVPGTTRFAVPGGDVRLRPSGIAACRNCAGTLQYNLCSCTGQRQEAPSLPCRVAPVARVLLTFRVINSREPKMNSRCLSGRL
jgi:hypothetical protein